MLIRVIEILFPMFFVVIVGYLCAKKTSIDMKPINRLNIDYFAPALVFSCLVDMPIGNKQIALINAGILAVIVPGIVIWLFTLFRQLDHKVWVPPHMFRNSGNLAIPLFVYTFGEIAKSDAVLLMVVSTCLQVTIGLIIISGLNKQGLKTLIRMPMIHATILSLAINYSGIHIWTPLLKATTLLGESSIPLMLFSLGSQLIYLNRSGIKIGILSTFTSLLSGAMAYIMIIHTINLPVLEKQMMVLFTMLPPAVMNHLFAERYKLDGPTVASMVLYGNFLSIITMPILLWYALSVVK
ncbi:AEC family transporter [Vibrio salinus]|uniref:AEC family transporter n=1 Tax=Vibrio salinus TaxID=2899784 RepID=UPI001E4CEE71|nr:AEC family transporter [Vibrio salinus]MCE0492584.1 AEC family transporter [Vibrio salinus]